MFNICCCCCLFQFAVCSTINKSKQPCIYFQIHKLCCCCCLFQSAVCSTIIKSKQPCILSNSSHLCCCCVYSIQSAVCSTIIKTYNHISIFKPSTYVAVVYPNTFYIIPRFVPQYVFNPRKVTTFSSLLVHAVGW